MSVVVSSVNGGPVLVGRGCRVRVVYRRSVGESGVLVGRGGCSGGV